MFLGESLKTEKAFRLQNTYVKMEAEVFRQCDDKLELHQQQ